MTTILITGATGQVGGAILKHLPATRAGFHLLAGVRNAEKYPSGLPGPDGHRAVPPITFDFADPASVREGLARTDILFLLRPPQLADVKKYFAPLLQIAKEESIRHIVFLSVQGAETNTFIPHHKIERLIITSGINYTFLRPAYFMQNFTSTLNEDLVKEKMIFLPAGQARFTLIDVADVGRVGAEVLTHSQDHRNRAYALTNHEQLSFHQMAHILSQKTGETVSFKSPNLLSFFWRKKRAGTPVGFILVMIMLHYLPRFSATPPTTDWVRKITGKAPRTFAEFVEANLANLRSS